MSDTNIHTGVYEQIINRLFKLKLNEVDAGRFYIGKKLISKDNAVHILSKYLQHLIEVAFAGTPDDQDADKYTDFVNSVIKTLGREFNVDDTELDLIDAQKSILTAVVDRTNCEYPDIEQHLKAITPTTSLSRSALFFGGKGPADMESELNREILCADEICWVVSFIKTSGLNLLWNSLRKFTSKGKKLRIITTTYTGATDYDAMVRLASLPNAEIKISYDGTQDRLHAKSYIFLRNSGFHTAYIGSSNLSLYALRDGKEWNFKATQFELPQVIDEVRHSFEAYWCDATFEDFIPGVSNARLKKALGADWETPLLDFSALDLMRAKDYQQEILERLDVERNVHGHFRNLVVAATGTGKTVIAAFDFKRFREAHPDCRFLFVAHRQEILRQAMLTFRIVLEDPNFGSLWDGDNEPSLPRIVLAQGLPGLQPHSFPQDLWRPDVGRDVPEGWRPKRGVGPCGTNKVCRQQEMARYRLVLLLHPTATIRGERIPLRHPHFLRAAEAQCRDALLRPVRQGRPLCQHRGDVPRFSLRSSIHTGVA